MNFNMATILGIELRTCWRLKPVIYCCELFEARWLKIIGGRLLPLLKSMEKPVYAMNLHCIHLEWLRFPPRDAKFEVALLKRRDSVLQLFTLLVLIALRLLVQLGILLLCNYSATATSSTASSCWSCNLPWRINSMWNNCMKVISCIIFYVLPMTVGSA